LQRRALDRLEARGRDKPWLVVYDNVESPKDIEGLTPRSNTHVVLTTRWSDWYGHASELPVEVFTQDVAIAYLMALAPGSAERPAETRADAARLAEDVGYLPLALSVARAHAWGMGWNFGQYGRHLAEMIAREPSRAVDYPRSIAATFTLAIDKAKSTSPEAERLVAIAAFLAPDMIPLDIIPSAVLSELELGEAVAAARRGVAYHPGHARGWLARYQRAQAVQDVMRLRLGAGAEEWAALATQLVADTYPTSSPDDVRNWSDYHRLESHTAAVLGHAPDIGGAAQITSRLLNEYALYLLGRAEYATAEPLVRRALAIDEPRLGPDNPLVAAELIQLALLLKGTNRVGEAEPLMRRVLEIDERSLGPEHPDVALHLNNLAGLLRDANRLVEAEPFYRRALEIDERSLGPEHPDVALHLNNLAGLLRDANRLGEAEPLYRRALSILETSLGADYPDTRLVHGNYMELLSQLPNSATDRASAPAQAKPISAAKPQPDRRGIFSRLLRR
jgi:tetratricopeptide (TPR) repeat protein